MWTMDMYASHLLFSLFIIHTHIFIQIGITSGKMDKWMWFRCVMRIYTYNNNHNK